MINHCLGEIPVKKTEPPKGVRSLISFKLEKQGLSENPINNVIRLIKTKSNADAKERDEFIEYLEEINNITIPIIDKEKPQAVFLEEPKTAVQDDRKSKGIINLENQILKKAKDIEKLEKRISQTRLNPADSKQQIKIDIGKINLREELLMELKQEKRILEEQLKALNLGTEQEKNER